MASAQAEHDQAVRRTFIQTNLNPKLIQTNLNPKP